MLTALTLARCGLAGGMLGLVFFGTLWLTVNRLANARHPALLMGASYLVRLVLAGVVFWFLASEGLACVLVGLVGFLVARQACVTYVRRKAAQEGEAWN
ncbi:MAG: ATP synthase subunit I [Gemmatimonadota bacterium]